jgi:hypothetical protein
MATPPKVQEAISKLPEHLKPFAEAAWPFIWNRGEAQFNAFLKDMLVGPVAGSTFQEDLANLAAANDAQAAINAQTLEDRKAALLFIGDIVKASISAALLL